MSKPMSADDLRRAIGTFAIERGWSWVKREVLGGRYRRLSEIPVAELRAVYARIQAVPQAA